MGNSLTREPSLEWYRRTTERKLGVSLIKQIASHDIDEIPAEWWDYFAKIYDHKQMSEVQGTILLRDWFESVSSHFGQNQKGMLHLDSRMLPLVWAAYAYNYSLLRQLLYDFNRRHGVYNGWNSFGYLVLAVLHDTPFLSARDPILKLLSTYEPRHFELPLGFPDRDAANARVFAAVAKNASYDREALWAAAVAQITVPSAPPVYLA